ncbi:MAG: homocysteine S-methyltransferase family protein [Planctomycetota bacterium]
MGFLERIRNSEPLVSDAAFGPSLRSMGIDAHGIERERLNIQRTDLVRAIHRSHIDAGADVVLTNTFSANAYQLGLAGRADELDAVNFEGAAAARAAADETAPNGRVVYAIGRIGPLWQKRLDPVPMNEVERRAAYRAQIAALIRAPLDGLLIETMMDLTEARLAILSARDLCDLPIAASIRYRIESDGRVSSPNGNPLSQCLHGLAHAGADVIGLNGAFDVQRLVAAGRLVAASSRRPIWARIAMGTSSRDGETREINSLDAAVQASRDLRSAGVRIIGGDAGSTAALIQGIRKDILSGDGQTYDKQ